MASLDASSKSSLSSAVNGATASAVTDAPSPSSGTGAAGSSAAADSPSASSAIDFLSLCQRLKTIKRAGWVRRGVREPESVADHMYRMGVMAFVAAYIPGVDRERCIKMALVHDVAEAIVGDITPSDGVPKDEKNRREGEAINHMCNLLGGGCRAKEMLELWIEYEENSSLEAKVVKDFDKVEMILQALEYEQDQGLDLDEFFQSTAGKFQTEVGKAWASEIASRRKTPCSSPPTCNQPTLLSCVPNDTISVPAPAPWGLCNFDRCLATSTDPGKPPPVCSCLSSSHR